MFDASVKRYADDFSDAVIDHVVEIGDLTKEEGEEKKVLLREDAEMTKAEWDESKHPRDEHGKFGESGDSRQFTGTAYRAHSGNRNRGTAADVVRFERDELGNEEDFKHLTDEEMKELEDRPASDLVWVTRDKESAIIYTQEDLGDEDTARPENVDDISADVKGGKVIATEGDGGYLVLKPKSTEKAVTTARARRTTIKVARARGAGRGHSALDLVNDGTSEVTK